MMVNIIKKLVNILIVDLDDEQKDRALKGLALILEAVAKGAVEGAKG